MVMIMGIIQFIVSRFLDTKELCKTSGQVSKDKCTFNPQKGRFWTCIHILSNESIPSLVRSQLNATWLILFKIKAIKRSINVVSTWKKCVANTSRNNSNEASDVIAEEKVYRK
jgi:hypothetical protein